MNIRGTGRIRRERELRSVARQSAGAESKRRGVQGHARPSIAAPDGLRAVLVVPRVVSEILSGFHGAHPGGVLAQVTVWAKPDSKSIAGARRFRASVFLALRKGIAARARAVLDGPDETVGHAGGACAQTVRFGSEQLPPML